MFDSDPADDRSSRKVTRRVFVFSAAAIGAGLYGWWFMSKSQPAEANRQDAKPNQKPEEVSIVEFSDSGVRQDVVHVPKIVKSESEWRQQLSSTAFEVARHDGTEMAFTGQYWNNHDPGLYRCICCDTALFNASTKFESGNRWRRKTWKRRAMPASAWCAPPFPAAVATPILATCLTTVPGPPASAIA
jgi:peptide-methionine (R)-S-oxide reductase